MCSLGFCSITLKVEETLGGGGGGGGGGPSEAAACCPSLPPHGPFLVLSLWKHTCFALLTVQMLDKETDSH